MVIGGSLFAGSVEEGVVVGAHAWPTVVLAAVRQGGGVERVHRLPAGGGEAAIDWNVAMATAILAMLPPTAVVVLMQKWFVKGLVDTEK